MVMAVAPDGVPAQYGVVVIFRLTTTRVFFFILQIKFFKRRHTQQYVI